jgi:hypothetical protein
MGLGTADGVMVPVSVSAPHNSALTTLAGGGPSGFIEYIFEVGARVPSRVVLEFGDAISGISRVSGQAARSIG